MASRRARHRSAERELGRLDRQARGRAVDRWRLRLGDTRRQPRRTHATFCQHELVAVGEPRSTAGRHRRVG